MSLWQWSSSWDDENDGAASARVSPRDGDSLTSLGRQVVIDRQREVMVQRLAEITRRHPPCTADTRPQVVIARRDQTERRILSAALEHHGFFNVVGEADDGAAAVALVIIDQPDLVILDQDLELLNGVETAIEVLAYAPNARIILLTGDADVAAHARRIGVDAVHGKAADPAWLPIAAADLFDDYPTSTRSAADGKA